MLCLFINNKMDCNSNLLKANQVEMIDNIPDKLIGQCCKLVNKFQVYDNNGKLIIDFLRLDLLILKWLWILNFYKIALSG